MKKIFSTMICAACLLTSCHYLDISPDMGMTSEEVFTNYSNFKNYLLSAYHGGTQYDTGNPANLFRSYLPMVLDATSRRTTFNSMTDISDSGRPLRSHVIKGGTMTDDNGADFTNGRMPIFFTGYVVIRIANNCIWNIDKIQDATEDQKNDLLGHAYFLRALCHSHICDHFGGVPYIDHALGGDDSYDLPRLTAYKTYLRAAEDAQKAYDCFVKAGLVRRDPGPGETGNLESEELNYPAGMAALALKSRILLYAASPLNNRSGDKKAWEAAANAAAEALSVAQSYGFSLEEWETWENNWKFAKRTNEQLWAWSFAAGNCVAEEVSNYHPYPIGNNKNLGGVCPTQNAVDLYETRWGDPLETEADRDAAIAAGHYKDQDPYSNRDPRFYKLVTFDGSSSEGAEVINIHYDPAKGVWPSTTLNSKSRNFGVAWGSETGMGVSNTGYYSRKYWDGKYIGTAYYHADPIFRLAELYLNYAEAANEAWGPSGKAEGCALTALDAVNVIRNRAGMPDVLSKYTGSTEFLRERIQNERTIEFMDEGHHYYKDERRWMIAPQRMRATLYGMYIESCTPSETYPKGRIYIRKPLSADRQSTWKDEMYYFFLPADEANKMKNFENNPTW